MKLKPEPPREEMFEDLLSPADRDMSKTVIDASDMARYEKSRTQAEVQPPPQLYPETPTFTPSRPLRQSTYAQLLAQTQPSTPQSLNSPLPSTHQQTP